MEAGRHMFGLSLFRPSRQSNISKSGEESLRFKYPLSWENKISQMPYPAQGQQRQSNPHPRTVKNNKNRSTWRQINNFPLAAHFFIHFFAVVLHDSKVKPPETRFMEEMLYVYLFTFFFTATHFHLSGC